MTPPRRPPPAYSSERASSVAAEAGGLVPGVDHEQREPPQPVAVDRERRAGQLPVVLGDPGPARVAIDQLVDAHERVLGRRRRLRAARCRRSPRSVKLRNESSWTASASSLRIGRGADIGARA